MRPGPADQREGGKEDTHQADTLAPRSLLRHEWVTFRQADTHPAAQVVPSSSSPPCSQSQSPSAPLSLFGIACQREGVAVGVGVGSAASSLALFSLFELSQGSCARGRFLNARFFVPEKCSFPGRRSLLRLQNRRRGGTGDINASEWCWRGATCWTVDVAVVSAVVVDGRGRPLDCRRPPPPPPSPSALF